MVLPQNHGELEFECFVDVPEVAGVADAVVMGSLSSGGVAVRVHAVKVEVQLDELPIDGQGRRCRLCLRQPRRRVAAKR